MKNRKVGLFTIHKSASMLHHKLLLNITECCGMEYYSANNPKDSQTLHIFPDVKKNNDSECLRLYNEISEGCVGPIRRPLKVSKDHSLLLILRHPFDGLVSMFNSFTKIHGGIPKDIRSKRLEKGIDSCVLDFSKDYYQRYEIYCEHFLICENVIFLKYEDMFTNPDGWISKFISPFDLSLEHEDKVKKQFFSEINTDNAKKGTHKNKMIPMQYATSLKNSTIETLLLEWKQVMDYLEYNY